MRRLLLTSLPSVCCAVALSGLAGAQQERAPSGVVLGANPKVSAAADAIRDGNFDEGIRLNLLALEHDNLAPLARAAALANLCAAYVSKEEPDTAIPYCDESLGLNNRNWRAYTIRARAYVLKEMYGQAALDNAAASAISPNARHVRMIEAIINEATLEPSITIKEHQ